MKESTETVYMGVKIRLYPTPEQEEKIRQTLGCCRFVYNHFLDKAQKDYDETKKKKSAYEYMNELTLLKKEIPWLKDADSQALQQSILDMDTAYKNFFRHTADFPRFKKKKNYGSYRTCSTHSRFIKNPDGEEFIKLPKLGNVRIRHHYDLSKIKKVTMITVSMAPSGKFYASLCTEQNRPVYEVGEGEVSVHLDTKEYMVYINGNAFPMPKGLQENITRLGNLQRSLSYKQDGSKNQEKARKRLAKYHEKISARRKDYLHKLSTDLVNEYQTIVLEPEPIREIMEVCSAEDSIKLTDISYYEFCRQIHYKAEWAGKTVVDLTTPEKETEEETNK